MAAPIRILLVLLAIAAVGCDRDTELDSKAEYSTLQSLEFDYRSSENSKPYVVVNRALGSKYDVLGLPRKGQSHGYVWLIANPDSQPDIKKIPADVEFVLRKGSLAELEKSIRMSPAVRDYLSSQAQ
jgi:hypothetical protein